jgi:5-methylcytosine-specific restriction endonuclease McrA
MILIDKYQRFQKNLQLHHLFPERNDGICACGCDKPLPNKRRKRWASDECRRKSYTYLCVIKGDTATIRDLLFQIERGFCRGCGVECGPKEWDADHIIPVHKGGGACDMDNFQTLCKQCHWDKSAKEARQRARV